MATISIASAKGGCGKTTLAIFLGTELALDGYKVALLDCDVNQHATAFGGKADNYRFAVAIGIVLWLVIGAIAGWLAGNIMKGGGFSLIGNIIVGIVGALIGGFVFGLFGITAGGLIGSLITAVVGACVLLFLVGLVKRA